MSTLRYNAAMAWHGNFVNEPQQQAIVQRRNTSANEAWHASGR